MTATVTVTETETVTATPDRQTQTQTPSASSQVVAVPTTTRPATTTSSPPAVPVVNSVSVLVERGGKGHLIGPRMFEATSWGKASLVVRWRAGTDAGELWDETCQVTTNVSGPGGFTHNDRSAECSGRIRANEIVVEIPGTYTVTTEVIGPDGASRATGTNTFEVFPDSTP